MAAAGRVIDISLGIWPGLLTWPGDPPVELSASPRIAGGDDANVSTLRMGTHAGTHVDPPVHFLEGGAAIDELDLQVLVGEALVADLRGRRGALTAAELEGLALPSDIERLLLKTDNSELWRSPSVTFPEEYCCLGPDAARWVVERGIRLVGVDFLSVEEAEAPGHATHSLLLGNGVIVVEGLNLADVEPGRYQLICLPLRILGGDGGPARAVLIEK